MGEQDISAYGVNDVGELLKEVTQENGETLDEPLVLVNGKPVANQNDIANYPAEAISRVEVLPRGSGTKVGGSPNRRVYNIVLKKQADIRIARAGLRSATEGGWQSRTGELSYTKIEGEKRFNGALTMRNDNHLLEKDRGITEPPGSGFDLSRFRTLQPSISSYQLTLSAADRLAPWLTGTLTGKMGSNGQQTLLGLDDLHDPSRQRGRTRTVNLDLALNADFGSWLVSLVGDSQYNRARTSTDAVGGRDPTQLQLFDTAALTSNASSTLTATGPLISLPGGRLQLTLAGAIAHDLISARNNVDAVGTTSRFVKQQEDFTGGFDIPVASRTKHFLSALGELTASVQFRRSHVSHFGSLHSQTFALTWQPQAWIRLFGSVTTGQTPPDIELLGGALLETPGTIYFDPSRDETVEVTEISGGNPDLTAASETNRRLTANLKPLKSVPLELTAEYSSVRDRGVITALPPASALIFAAFPDRFVRNADGVLTSVDVRPVQFAKEDQDQLRYGVNLSLPLGRSRSTDALVGTKAGTPVSDGSDGAASKGASTAVADSPASAHPRLQFNISYAQLLSNRLQMARGTNIIDLLSRSAIGPGGLGHARHQLDFSAGYTERGIGVRLTGQYRSVTYLNLGDAAGADVLRFSPLATFSLRSWLEPSRFVRARWLERSRVTFSVVNITDRRQSVRNANGVTPLVYQPAYRDPLGRTVEFELRKQF